MATMPPSSSPSRQSPAMYRDNSRSSMDGETTNEMPQGLDELVARMKVGGSEAVEMGEVEAVFRGTGIDDSGQVRYVSDLFVKSFSMKEETNESEPTNSSSATQQQQPQSFATPTENQVPPRGDASTPFDEDNVTPQTSNATPMSFARKTPTTTPSESVRRARGRSASRPRSGASRSRARTPIGSLFRKTTPTSEGIGQSSAKSARSQSPFARFFGKNEKPELTPENPRGAIPRPSSSRSRMRPARTGYESMTAETPAAKSVDSFPSPPSTAGNTRWSPTPSKQQWTPRPRPESPHRVRVDSTQKNGGYTQPATAPSMDQPNFGGNPSPRAPPPPPQPGFADGLQQSMSWSGAQATVPPSVAPFPAGLPNTAPVLFNVNLKSSKSDRTKKTGRRGSDKRAARAGGPEKPTVQTDAHPFVPSQGISRTYSADSVLQQNGPPRIFISSPPSIPEQQPAESFSPEDMDMSPETENAPPMPAKDAAPFQFSIGAGGKKTSRGVGRPRRGSRKPSSPARGGSVHRRHGGLFPRTSPAKAKVIGSSGIHPNGSQETAESSGGQTLRTESTCSSEVDYSGRRALVTALRDEARDAYTRHDFRGAVYKYSSALNVHVGESTATHETDDLRALLLANRAAALLMLQSYDAAGADCQSALSFVSDLKALPASLATDRGPTLRAKLFCRIGKILLRLGKLPEAEQAFYNTVNTAHATLAVANQIGQSEETERTKVYLTQLITDAEAGTIEVNRCREAAEELSKFGNVSSTNSNTSSRREYMKALLYANKALEFAPGAMGFHEKKVSLLASLKRWRELAGHCERLAASFTQVDGLFEGDLANWNPFPGVKRAEALTPTFFDANDPAESSTKKLGANAASEAAVRLPHTLLPFYLRALRLEERNAQASSAISALEKVVKHAEGTSHHQTLRMKFAFLSREKDKLKRSSSGKDKGDSLFRNGDYEKAAAQYTSCLTIDAEGLPVGQTGEVSNAGGRYHAILHCNRAACLMALKKYHEAVTDCTSALRIHSHYMKAMLRRSRCYSRLQRYQEAIVEYNRWLELVEKAKLTPNDPDLSTTPCLFDSPKEIKDDELKKVKQELEDMKRAKRVAENSARSQSNSNSSRHQGSFGRSAGARDAHQRREEWYNQKASSARRWDSFAGRSPKRESNRSGHQSQDRQRTQSSRFNEQRSQSQNGFNGRNSHHQQQRKVHLSPVSNPNTDHYTVLDIPRNATEAEIKRAFRKMALKYHPDKCKDPEAADKFRRVKAAYEVLNDTASRRRYDAEMLWSRRF